MPIHLIRHAHAGSRKKWDGDDRLRPLSERGRAQTGRMDLDLADAPVDELWSSPFVRCVQTLEPLAERRSLPIAEVDLLAEGASGREALDALLAAAGDGRTVAASTHGDVMDAVVAELQARGCVIDGATRARKGDRYVLEVDGRRPVRATHVPLPGGD